MDIGNTTEWLAAVSKLCRHMTEQAVVAFRDAQYEDPQPKGTLEAVQSVLRRDLDALTKLLPEDFPKSRVGDLSRHVSYCHAHDCLDIAGFDLPDIMEKAEGYAMSQQPAQVSGEIGSFLHAQYRARLDREMAMSEPDYHALVLKAAIILGDTFKAKSGAMDDKDAEIGKALNVDRPRICIPNSLTGETNRNFQRGTMLLLQGVRAFYRNTHAHGQINTNHRHAVHALVIMSMLIELIEGAHVIEQV